MFLDWVHKAYIASLFLIVATLPYSIGLNNGAIAVLLVSWLLLLGKDSLLKLRQNRDLILLFCAVYILLLVSLLWTSNRSEGFFYLEKTAALLLFPVVLGTGPKIRFQTITYILITFLLSVVCASVICLIDRIDFIYDTNRPLWTLFKYYNTHLNFLSALGLHPTYFSMYVILSLIILLWLHSIGLLKKRLTDQFLVVVLVLFFSLVLFLSASRIMLLLAISGGLIFIFIYIKKKLGLFYSAAVGIMIIMLSILGFSALPETINTKKRVREMFTDNVVDSHRYSIGESRMSRWGVILQHPEEFCLVGVGVGDSKDYMVAQYSKHSLVNAVGKEYNAHNIFIELVLKTGFLGPVLFLLALLIPLLHAWKLNTYIYGLFLVVILFAGLTESILNVQKGVVFYSFFNSLFAFNSLKRANY